MDKDTVISDSLYYQYLFSKIPVTLFGEATEDLTYLHDTDELFETAKAIQIIEQLREVPDTLRVEELFLSTYFGYAVEIKFFRVDSYGFVRGYRKKL